MNIYNAYHGCILESWKNGTTVVYAPRDGYVLPQPFFGDLMEQLPHFRVVQACENLGAAIQFARSCDFPDVDNLHQVARDIADLESAKADAVRDIKAHAEEDIEEGTETIQDNLESE